MVIALLAEGISYAEKITIIALCIAVIIFLAVDIVLVVALNKLNKKLVKYAKEALDKNGQAASDEQDDKQ